MFGLLLRFRHNRRANVTILFALTLPALIFAVGIGVDFSRAVEVRAKLNAAADAAALAALTPAMMQQSITVAQNAAKNMFLSQVAGISSLNSAATVVAPVITNPNGNVSERQIVVSYSAQSRTLFSGILKVPYLALGGSSKAKASVPPNIDFYLLLDNSPSMALPAAASDINRMQILTSQQYSGAGCAFACHQANTNNGDTAGNSCGPLASAPTLDSNYNYPGHVYCAAWQGAQIDNYQLAKNNSITLRLDELSAGVTTLMNTAADTANSGQWPTPPAYRFAVYSLDTLWSVPSSDNRVMPLSSNYQTDWASNSSNFGVMKMFSNSNGCGDAACLTGAGNNDQTTSFDVGLNSINAIMPSPGQGTNVSGDSPQEVLFFVTDGVEDENSGGIRLIQQINAGTAHNYCADIKSRGVKIAILYTEYLPVPVNSFYVGNVEPFQTQIGPALKDCASSGLFYDAEIGADLGKALSTLFQAAVQSATLTQ